MLSNWLSPIADSEISSFFNQYYDEKENFPDLTAAKVVVFSRAKPFTLQVRRALDKLHNHFDITIYDIGNLSSGNISGVYQILSELQDGRIIPILIGVNRDEFIEICNSLLAESKIPIASFISNKISLQSSKFIVNHLSYQRHLLPLHEVEDLISSDFPGLSLGGLRTSQKILEPILRESNYLHFDLAAIRKSDISGIDLAIPTGLYAEEACQIMRYAGESPILNLVTIDIHDLNDTHSNEAMLVAEMIWYLCEGINIKSMDHPTNGGDFKKYIIEMNEVDHSLEFYQSQISGKWWFKTGNQKAKFISCAYEEYEETLNKELPERLLKLL